MPSLRSAGVLLGIVLVLLVASTSTAEGRFDETLTVFPLADNGRVAMLFNFSLEWDSDETGTFPSCFSAHKLVLGPEPSC